MLRMQRCRTLSGIRASVRCRPLATAPPARESASSLRRARLVLSSWPIYFAVLFSICGATVYISLGDDRLLKQKKITSATSHPLSWQALRVLKVDDVGDGDTRIVTLHRPPGLATGQEERLHIDSIYIKQPDLQIQRPYTPLDPVASPTIRLLVKRYRDGEVSSYIHSLPVGGALELRGPAPSWQERIPGSTKEIVFIAGGTGVTPFLQLAHRLLASSDPPPSPKLSLVFAARSPASLYLRPFLDDLVSRFPSRISVRYVVDEDPGRQPASWWERLAGRAESDDGGIQTVGRIDALKLERWIGKSEHVEGRVVLISGPESLVSAVAGPRAQDGRSQGPVGGMLRRLGYTSDEVWKL